MVVDQLSTQCFCARSTCTLMPLLLLSPGPRWLSNTLNLASPCAPLPSLSVSAKRPSAAGWLAPKESGFPTRLVDRSSVPHHQPRKTTPQLEARILALRRQRRSYAQIMMVLPVSKATLSRVLRRHHLNRLSSLDPPKAPPRRYERATPGELLPSIGSPHAPVPAPNRRDRAKVYVFKDVVPSRQAPQDHGQIINNNEDQRI
jgi:hypothetical protein